MFKKLLVLPPLVLASPALAQTASPDDVTVADQRNDDIVVVASGVAQDADDTGRAVTVFDRATIDQRQTVSVSELLATAPGVTVSRTGGIGSVTGVRIRGAESEQTLVLIDGVRVNDPSSPGGAFDFGNLLAGSVERVEVLRGPDSVAWGSQAIGGVVNVITEHPTDGLHVRANAEYGYADQALANAAVSAGNDTVQGAVTGSYLRSDGISQYAGGDERDGYRQAGGSGRLSVALSPDVGIDLRGYYAHSKLEIDGYPAPYYVFADDPEYGTTQEVYGYAGVHAQLGPVANRVAFTIADINRDNYDPTVSQDVPSYFYRGRSERYTYQGDAQLLPMARLVVGAEQENVRFYDGSATYRANLTSGYGELVLTPVEAVTLTGGVRYDDHNQYGGHTSLTGALAVKPAAGTLLRASYSDGFKAPTLYQLYAPYYGTTSLQPETAKSYEVGARQTLLDGGISFGATWFHRNTHNQIDFDTSTYTYQNIARTRAEGVELELGLRPVQNFTVTGNYSFVNSENRSAGANYGKDLALRPHDTASIAVDYQAPFGLSLGATLLMVGDSYNNAANTTRLDGYAVASLRAEMRLNRQFSIYGRIDNVTDERYQVVSGYGTYGRAAYGGVRVRLD